jgi:DNA polymerase-3 subunit delta'
VTDLFDRLVGQAEVAQALRAHAERPVHAYLLVGGDSTVTEMAAVHFAAALQCEQNGCGHCEVCRLVLEGKHPDVDFHRSDGGNWQIDEIRVIGTESMLRPRQDSWHIEIIDHIERTVTGAASYAALLKVLEEPAEKTIFLLTANSLPKELVTIESRCVLIRLHALNVDEIERMLIQEGAEHESARAAAISSSGSLRRARVLLRDQGVVDRLALWRGLPDQIDGDISTAIDLVAGVRAEVDSAIAVLKGKHAEELATWKRNREELKIRTESKDDIDSRHRRELRLFRAEELGFLLRVLTEIYRGRMAALVEASPSNESDARLRSAIAALELLAHTGERLSETNIEEELLLTDLFVSLSRQ